MVVIIIKEITLTQLPVGENAKVVSLTAQDKTRLRLLDLGFIPGTKVENLRSSPAGNPKAYLIRGAVIALRKEETDTIFIQRD